MSRGEWFTAGIAIVSVFSSCLCVFQCEGGGVGAWSVCVCE